MQKKATASVASMVSDVCKIQDAKTSGGLQSLNLDPFNVRSEEMALEDCSHGLEVRRTWSEQELVRSFGGQMPPGTPDGMFETWDGTLTCVQVVRVPLVKGADHAAMQHTLTQTILCKVVKSQSWLRSSSIAPHDFIIFCWLPFEIPELVRSHIEELMSRVRMLDHRFFARLRLPAEPHMIFPTLFACNHDSILNRSRSLSESDVSTFEDCESEDDDEVCEWDITWDWAGAESADSVDSETSSNERGEPRQDSECLFQEDCRVCDALQLCENVADQFPNKLYLPWDDNG